MVRLACDLCPRRGQYRKETLVGRFGGDVLMPRASRYQQEGLSPGAWFVRCFSTRLRPQWRQSRQKLVRHRAQRLASERCDYAGGHRDRAWGARRRPKSGRSARADSAGSRLMKCRRSLLSHIRDDGLWTLHFHLEAQLAGILEAQRQREGFSYLQRFF
jgi:hypothetical protein